LQRVRSTAVSTDNTPLATAGREAARRQIKLTHIRGLPRAVHHIRSERRIAFGARKFIDPRGRSTGRGHVRTPVTIGRGCYQGGEVITHIGITVVNDQRDRSHENIFRLVVGPKIGNTTISLPQKINWHAITSS
jgi:hypothetical protein